MAVINLQNIKIDYKNLPL